MLTKNALLTITMLCRCSTGANRPVTVHFWRVGNNVYMVGHDLSVALDVFLSSLKYEMNGTSHGRGIYIV